MGTRWARHRDVTAAERGQIIQRVLVDGWSPAEAALLHGLDQREVARWVTQYRRNGMASLRLGRGADALPWHFAEWLRAKMPRLMWLARGEMREAAPAPCIVLRRGGDKRRPR